MSLLPTPGTSYEVKIGSSFEHTPQIDLYCVRCKDFLRAVLLLRRALPERLRVGLICLI